MRVQLIGDPEYLNGFTGIFKASPEIELVSERPEVILDATPNRRLRFPAEGVAAEAGGCHLYAVAMSRKTPLKLFCLCSSQPAEHSLGSCGLFVRSVEI